MFRPMVTLSIFALALGAAHATAQQEAQTLTRSRPVHQPAAGMPCGAGSPGSGCAEDGMG